MQTALIGLLCVHCKPPRVCVFKGRSTSSQHLCHSCNLYKVIKAGACCFLCAAPGLQQHWHCASWTHILEPLTSWMWGGTKELFVSLTLVTDKVTEAIYVAFIFRFSSCSWKYSIKQSVPSWSQTFQKPTWQSGLVSQSCQSQMLVWTSEKMNNKVWVMAGSLWEQLCLCQDCARGTGSEAFQQRISLAVYLHYHFCSLACLFSKKRCLSNRLPNSHFICYLWSDFSHCLQ